MKIFSHEINPMLPDFLLDSIDKTLCNNQVERPVENVLI